MQVTMKEGGSTEDKFIRNLHKGDFFGEKALSGEEVELLLHQKLKSHKCWYFQVRTANIIADTGDPEGEVKCLVIDRDTFTQLIANLEEIKKRYIDLPARKMMWVAQICSSRYISGKREIDQNRNCVHFFWHFSTFQHPRRIQGIEAVRPSHHCHPWRRRLRPRWAGKYFSPLCEQKIFFSTLRRQKSPGLSFSMLSKISRTAQTSNRALQKLWNLTTYKTFHI